MARPRASAASITLASPIEPPGWITAVAPASAAWISPSGKGKKASEAQAEPTASDCGRPAVSAASWARIAAMRAESRRFIWPAPIPAVWPSLAKITALDFTCLATVKANSMSRTSASVGWRLVTIFRSSAVMWAMSRLCTRKPPATERNTSPVARGSGRAPVTRRRRFFLAAKTAMASSSASGAITTSVKISTMARAAAASSRRLTATMPPKAETGSHCRAR